MHGLQDGFCAIHVAVKYGGAAFVELLLSKKASVDAQTEVDAAI